ncbi:MAG: hypothetical protein R3A79_11970 [Nannocystaceae bacterium]
MRKFGIRLLGGLLGASLLALPGCAEQPGKKKEEKSQPVDGKKADVNKTDEAKDEKAEEKKVE